MELSDTQVQPILRNNDEISRWAAERQTRANQVLIELAIETEKDVPEALALGARYVELETLCREIRNQCEVYRKKNLDSSTQSQRTKLQVLEEAVKLGLISDAQYANLLGASGFYPRFYAGNILNGNFSLGSSWSPPVEGCAFLPFPQFSRPPQATTTARTPGEPASKPRQ